jgi:uncharacterized protein (TIGR03086 family)
MPTTTSPLHIAGEQFRDLVTQVTDDQFGLITPCDDWTVLELIGHVVGGNQMAAAIVGGASRNEAIGLLATDFVGDDPVGAVEASIALQHAAFELPDADGRVCQHPAGDMPGHQLRNFRISDLLVHQWDLARAIGADESLDPDVVRVVWDDISPMKPIIAQLGVFGDGPSGDVSEDAPLQERLLDLMGRRP